MQDVALAAGSARVEVRNDLARLGFITTHDVDLPGCAEKHPGAHDFDLGRRNCQRFLRSHFTLAAGNPSLQQVGGSELPVIPLLGSAAVEQVLPTWPAGRFDRDEASGRQGETVADSLRRRIAHLQHLALPLGLRLLIALFLLLPRFVTSRILGSCALDHIETALRKHQLSAD